jgi:hypothetical protein
MRSRGLLVLAVLAAAAAHAQEHEDLGKQLPK